MIARFEKFTFSIFELYRYLHKIAADEMKPYGLKGPYAFYIAMLHRNGCISATRLGELCGRDKADVSRAVTVLEQKGILSKSNAYRATLQLTPKGEELALTLNKRIQAAVSYAGKDLSEQDRNVFYSALESLVHNLHTLSENGMEA